MSAIVFDPWAALQVRRAARAAANPANVAKKYPDQTPVLAVLAGLAEARGGAAPLGGVHQPTPACGGDNRPARAAATSRRPTHARAAASSVTAPPRARTAVPEDWARGLIELATMPIPATIEPRRWFAFVGMAERLLHDHGPELHAAGWTALDLFGLDATAPETNPAGWGLAWLLGTRGQVLDVGGDNVGIRWGPGGARLAFRRRPVTARSVLAWEM